MSDRPEETFYQGPSGIHLAAFPPRERWDDWKEQDSKAWPERRQRRFMLVPTALTRLSPRLAEDAPAKVVVLRQLLLRSRLADLDFHSLATISLPQSRSQQLKRGSARLTRALHRRDAETQRKRREKRRKNLCCLREWLRVEEAEHAEKNIWISSA